MLSSSCCVAAAAIVAPTGAQADSPNKWSGHAETVFRPGTYETRGSLELFLPLGQDEDSIFFLDARINPTNIADIYGNWGLGFRQIVGPDLMLGGYAFLDAKSKDGNAFYGGTVGIEAMTSDFDARFNVHVPLSGAKTRSQQMESGFAFVGNRLVEQMTDTLLRDKPMWGFDGEVGVRVPVSLTEGDELRLFAGAYHYWADDVRSVTGGRGTLEYRLSDVFGIDGSQLSIGGTISYDNVDKVEAAAEIRLRVPLQAIIGGPASGPVLSPLERRATERVRRDLDIRLGEDASGSGTTTRFALNAAGTEYGYFYFADGAGTMGSGDDSDPTTLEDAVLNATAVSASTTGGFVVLDGRNGPITTDGVTLQADQTLIGAGQSVQALSLTGTVETVSLGGTDGSVVGNPAFPVFTLADGVTLQDFTVTGGSIGILGDGINGATISNVTVSGATGDGMQFNNTTGTIAITNATIGGASGSAGEIGGDGISATNVENLAVSGSTITGGTGGSAIAVDTGAGNTSVAIDSSTLGTLGANGVVELDGTAGAGNLTVSSLSGNTIVGGQGEDGGILVDTATFQAPGGGNAAGGNTTVGTATDRVNGSGIVLNNVDGGLSFGDLDIATMGSATDYGLFIQDAGSGFNLSTTSGSINVTGGTAVKIDPVTTAVTLDSITSTNATGTAAILLDRVSGAFTVLGQTTITSPSGAGLAIVNSDGTFTFNGVSITSPDDDGIYLSGNSGPIDFGDVTISDPGAAGINVEDTNTGQVTFGDVDITGVTAGSVGLDLVDGTTSTNVSITFDTLDISGTGGTGIDMTGSTNTGNVRTLESSTMTGLDVGVDLTSAATSGMFQYGDGSDTDANGAASTINAGTPIVITGLDGTTGTYNFEDVELIGDVSSLVSSQTVYFAADGATGSGNSIDDPGSIADAEIATADIVVLVNSNGSSADTIMIGGDGTFTLDASQQLWSFNGGDSFALAGGAPSNVELHGVGNVIVNPFAGLTPTLSTSGTADTLAWGGDNVLDGVIIENGGTGALVDINGVAGGAIRDTILRNGGGNGLDLNGVTSQLTATDTTIADVAGAAVNVTGGSADISLAGTFTNASGTFVSVSGRTGGDIDFFGTLTGTGDGIRANGNTGGTLEFNGAVSLETETNVTAVELTGNSNFATTFHGLGITTDFGIGLRASGGELNVVSTIGDEIVNAVNAQALELTGVSTTTGIHFDSVTSGGNSEGVGTADNGIYIDGLSGAGDFSIETATLHDFDSYGLNFRDITTTGAFTIENVDMRSDQGAAVLGLGTNTATVNLGTGTDGFVYDRNAMSTSELTGLLFVGAWGEVNIGTGAGGLQAGQMTRVNGSVFATNAGTGTFNIGSDTVESSLNVEIMSTIGSAFATSNSDATVTVRNVAIDVTSTGTNSETAGGFHLSDDDNVGSFTLLRTLTGTNTVLTDAGRGATIEGANVSLSGLTIGSEMRPADDGIRVDDNGNHITVALSDITVADAEWPTGIGAVTTQGYGIAMFGNGGGSITVTDFSDITVTNTSGTRDGTAVLLNAVNFDADGGLAGGGDVDFTGDTVSGGTLNIGQGGTVVGDGLVMTDVTGDIAFDAINVNATGTAVNVTGGTTAPVPILPPSTPDGFIFGDMTVFLTNGDEIPIEDGFVTFGEGGSFISISGGDAIGLELLESIVVTSSSQFAPQLVDGWSNIAILDHIPSGVSVSGLGGGITLTDASTTGNATLATTAAIATTGMTPSTYVTAATTGMAPSTYVPAAATGPAGTMPPVEAPAPASFDAAAGSGFRLAASAGTVGSTTSTGVSMSEITAAVTLTDITANGGTNGIYLNQVAGSFTVSGDVDITGSTGAGVFLQNNSATLAFNGTTTIAGPGGNGIDISGSSAAITFGDVDITGLGANTGLDLNGASLTGALSFNSLDVTGTGAAGSIAIDLRGVTGGQMINVGAQADPASGPSSTISAVETGVFLNASSDAAFVFGDGESVSDQLSTIDATVAIDASSAPTSGTYNFQDVEFDGSPGLGFGIGTVYYVDADGAIGGGDGSGSDASNPMTLAAAELAAGSDDIIVLINNGTGFTSAGTNGDDTFNLADGQQLLSFGDGAGGSQAVAVNLTVPSTILLSSAVAMIDDPTGNGAATVTTSAGNDVITLGASGNLIRGLILEGNGTAANGIIDNGAGASNATIDLSMIQNFATYGVDIRPSTNTTISNSTFSGNAADVILNAAGTTISNVTSTNATGTAFQIDNASGATTLTNVSVTNAGGSAFSFFNASGTVTGTNVDIDGTGAAALSIAGGDAAFTFDGTSSLVQGNNAAAVSVSGGHSGSLAYTGTISATDGTGLQFNNAVGTTYSFNGTVTLNGGDAGVDIVNGSSASFTFGTLNITNPTGVAFNIENSTTFLTWSAGSLTQNNSATAFRISNSGGGAHIIGASITASTGAANAVDITGSTATYSFNGGLDLTTTSGTGFNVTGGTVSVANAGTESIVTTSGTALNLSGVTIGTGGFNLDSITVSSGGGNDGIDIDTVTTSAGQGIAIGTADLDGHTGVAIDLNAISGDGGFTLTTADIDLGTNGAGIDISGSNGTFTFGDVDIAGLGAATGLDLNGATLTGTLAFNSLAVTGTGAAGSIGIDLTGLLGNQTVNIGSQVDPATGPSSSLTNIETGVLIDATASVQFTFGDGEDTADVGSLIDVTSGGATVDASGGTLPGSSFNFLDVAFGAGDTPNFPSGGSFVFVDDTATTGVGDGSFANPFSVEDANNVAGSADFVFLDGTYDFASGSSALVSETSFSLATGQTAQALANDNTVLFGLATPSNISGDFGMTGGTVTGSGASLTNSSGNPVFSLLGGNTVSFMTLDGIPSIGSVPATLIAANGLAGGFDNSGGILVEGIIVTELDQTGTLFGFDDLTGNVTVRNNAISVTAGRLFEINAGDANYMISAGTLPNSMTAGTLALNNAAGQVGGGLVMASTSGGSVSVTGLTVTSEGFARVGLFDSNAASITFTDLSATNFTGTEPVFVIDTGVGFSSGAITFAGTTDFSTGNTGTIFEIGAGTRDIDASTVNSVLAASAGTNGTVFDITGQAGGTISFGNITFDGTLGSLANRIIDATGMTGGSSLTFGNVNVGQSSATTVGDYVANFAGTGGTVTFADLEVDLDAGGGLAVDGLTLAITDTASITAGDAQALNLTNTVINSAIAFADLGVANAGTGTLASVFVNGLSGTGSLTATDVKIQTANREGISLQAITTTGDFTFANVDMTSNNAGLNTGAFVSNGSHTATLNIGTGANGISIDNVVSGISHGALFYGAHSNVNFGTGTAGMQIGATNAMGGTGISLNTNSTGTFVFGNAATNNVLNAGADTAGAVGFNYNNSDATVTLNSVDINQTGSNAISGHGISIADDDTDGSFTLTGTSTIDNAAADGIHIAGGNVSISGVTIGGSGAPGDDGIDITDGAADTFIALANVSVTNATGTGIAIDGSTAAGTLFVTGFDGLTVSAAGAGGILLDTVSFDGDTGTAGLQALTATNPIVVGVDAANRVNGDGLRFDLPSGQLDLGTLTVFNDGGTGLFVDTKTGGPTTFTLNNSGGSVDTTGGAAMFLDPLSTDLTFGTVSSTGSGTTGVTFDAVDAVGGAGTNAVTITTLNVTNATGTGVLIDGSSGDFDLGSTTISGGAGAGIAIVGGSAAVTFDGGSSLTQTANAAAFSVSGGHTGSVTYTGSINATNGTGLQFDNAVGTTYSFNGNVTLNGGDAGVDIVNGSDASFTFGTLNITNPTGVGFNIDSSTAGVTWSNGTLTQNNAATAFRVNSATGGIVNISADIVSNPTTATILSFSNSVGSYNFTGTNTLTGGTGGGIAITGGSAAVTFGGGTSLTQSGNGAAFSVSGGHTGSVTYTGSINATDGTGLQFDNAVGTTYSFNGNVTLNGGDAGVDIVNGSDASFTFGTLNITSPTGVGFNIDSSTAGVTWSNGTLTQNNAATAFRVNNSGGIRTINASIGGNTTTATAIDLTNHLGATNFGGDLTIMTTSGTGFAASGGGTIAVTGTNTSINTTTGQVLGWDGVSVGATGVTFDTLAASGSVNDHVISINNVDGAGTFNGGNVTVAGTAGVTQTGITISGGSAATFTFASATIDNTPGDAIRLSGANGAVTFTTVDIDNIGSNGIQILNNTSAVNINGGSIGATIETAGDGVRVDGGSGDITIAASINKTSTSDVVEVTNRTGGTVEFSGALSSSGGAGAGIRVTNNTGGTTTFSNASKTLSTGIFSAVTVTGNSAPVAVNFTGGGLDIDTTSGTGFTATGSGTVTVQGSGNSVTSTNATALIINGVDFGAAGVTFESVSSNNASNGIYLKDTGSSGFFTITGSGTTDSSGGTIQNITGATGPDSVPSATGAGIGIYLENVENISLSNVAIQNTSNFGLRGFTVTDMAMSNVDVTGTHGDSTAEDEGAVLFDDLYGTVTVTGGTYQGGIEDTFAIENLGVGSPATVNITVDGATFLTGDGTAGRQGSEAFQFVADAGTSSVTIENSTFNGAAGFHILISPEGSSNVTAVIDNNTFLPHGSIVTGGGNVVLRSASSGTFDLTFTDNDMSGIAANGHALILGSTNTGSAFTGTVDATVTGNTIGSVGVAGSGSGVNASGIHVDADGAGSSSYTISNNVINQHDLYGINVQLGEGGAQNMELVINNNQITQSATNFELRGIYINNSVDVAHAPNVCVDIQGNTIASNTNYIEGIRIRSRQNAGATIQIVGGSADPNPSEATLEALVAANNPGNANAVAVLEDGGNISIVTACP